MNSTQRRRAFERRQWWKRNAEGVQLAALGVALALTYFGSYFAAVTL